jgi:hypothetical protein
MFRIHSAAYFALGLSPMLHFPGHNLMEAAIHFALATVILLEHGRRRGRPAKTKAPPPDAP